MSRCFNHERPHQALGRNVPGELYTRSSRRYQGLADLHYPLPDWTGTVTHCRICHTSRKINLSQSRDVMLVRLRTKETHTVIRALARRIRRLPHGLMKSLTWDRGTELAAHRAFTLATRLNTRPRMTLGYRTPAAKLAKIVATTG